MLTAYVCVRRDSSVDDDVLRRVVVLLLEDLRSGEVPPLIATGAWRFTSLTLIPRPPTISCVCSEAMELDICGIAVSRLRSLGTPDDWVVRVLCKRIRVYRW